MPLTLDVTPTQTQRWPGIFGADPALNQRVVNSYFRNWYDVTKGKWATPIYILVITKRWMRGVLAFTAELVTQALNSKSQSKVTFHNSVTIGLSVMPKHRGKKTILNIENYRFNYEKSSKQKLTLKWLEPCQIFSGSAPVTGH